MLKNVMQVIGEENFDALLDVIERVYEKESNEFVINNVLNPLYDSLFANKNDVLLHLYLNTFKDVAYNIAKKQAMNVEQVTHEDIYQSSIEYILSYDFEAKEEEGKKASYFNDFRFILADIKFLAHQFVAREIRIKQKQFSKDGQQILVDKGYQPTFYDKKEVFLDLENILDEKELKVFRFYVQGDKVREIEKKVKNGRRIYDKMKAKLEKYYFECGYNLTS